MNNENDPQIQILYEGESINVFRIEDEDGEVGYDVNLFGTVTIHFLREEWEEFLDVMHSLSPEK